MIPYPKTVLAALLSSWEKQDGTHAESIQMQTKNVMAHFLVVLLIVLVLIVQYNSLRNPTIIVCSV